MSLLHYALFHSPFFFFFARIFLTFFKIFFSLYSHVFTHVFDTNMLVFKTQVKMREKCEGKKTTRIFFLYYTMRWVKTQVSCVFLAFWNV